jgi:hypothetical protein
MSLFPWKSHIFNVFPKTYRGYIPHSSNTLNPLLEVFSSNLTLSMPYGFTNAVGAQQRRTAVAKRNHANPEIGAPRDFAFGGGIG